MNKKQLEKDFKKALKESAPKIEKQMMIARAAIDEAAQICEEYGVPMMALVSPGVQPYVPNSFREKWVSDNEETKDDEIDFMYNLCSDLELPTNNTGWFNDGEWINSQFCE